MDVSVAMCTYNGDQYLEDQIESILHQSTSPDEIVICDDGSTDSTVSIAKEYREKYSDLIKIYSNTSQLGVTKNFERAISLCSGDVIALSDQDDIWNKHKIEKQLQVLQRSKPSLTFHNSEVVNEKLASITNLWSSLERPYDPNDIRCPIEELKELTYRNMIQGASIMFDSQLKRHCLPIPEFWQHDYYIGVVGALVGGIHGIDERLLKYRQHPKQEIGISTRSIGDRILNAISTGSDHYNQEKRKWGYIYETLKTHSPEETYIDYPRARELLRERWLFAKHRANVYDSNAKPRDRIRSLIKNIRENSYEYSSGGKKAAAKDCLVIVIQILNNLISYR